MDELFSFPVLLLTDQVIDDLGFGTYNDGAGNFGSRRVLLGDHSYEIREIDSTKDRNEGYFDEKIYVSSHFTNCDFADMFFLHEIYVDIVKRLPVNAVESFIYKCSENNMLYYINAYNNSKK